jgi:rhodanese-related sulfurtransferase
MAIRPILNSVLATTALLSGLFLQTDALAVDVKLTPEYDSVIVRQNGQAITVQRIQDTNHVLSGGFTKTSRACPPFCIQPTHVAPGVETVGEMEIFEFMNNEMREGQGVLVDARTPSWHEKGTIPGSINIPFTVFEADPNDPTLQDAFKQLRVKHRDDVSAVTRAMEKFFALFGWFGADMKNDNWDFTMAKDVVLWCNGPWCGQSPHAIKAMIAQGYPVEKIKYYRGGMQMWKILGLTVVAPSGNATVASND